MSEFNTKQQVLKNTFNLWENYKDSFCNFLLGHKTLSIPDLQSWTLIICTFTISTGFRTTSEVGGSFYIYKSQTYRFFYRFFM